MKITNCLFSYKTIHPIKRKKIKILTKEYDKRFSDVGLDKWRNRIGMPFHLCGFLTGMEVTYNSLKQGDIALAIIALTCGKMNLDYNFWINNINKIKAAGLSKYLKEHNILEEKELIYAIKKYLSNNGSFHYPIFHPDKTRKIALNSEINKNIETGIFYTRTDKKGLLYRLCNKIY